MTKITGEQSILQNLFLETRNCLNVLCSNDSRILGSLSFINQINPETQIEKPVSFIPKHEDLLEDAISNVTDSQFFQLQLSLQKAKNYLHWKVDKGGYYHPDADVGEGYKRGNMHTLLIGPENSLIKADDFLLGFFLLSSKTLYRDHNHTAPEFYVPLTGPSGWRFDLSNWHDLDAGSVIFNAPDQVHATRSYETPFFALFCWPQDISSVCHVIDADDWEEIENNLRA